MATITNEVLAEKIDAINLRLAEMKKQLDEMPSAFVSHEVLELKLSPIDSRLTELETRKTALTWGIPIATTVATAVVTFLVIAFIQGNK